MAVSSRFSGISVALANRNYRYYTFGSIPSLLGTWIQRMAMGWLAWELTKSGTWLGLIAFADLAPTVITAPIAGAFADRIDRLKMVRLVQYANILQASVLAFFALTDQMTIELLLKMSASIADAIEERIISREICYLCHIRKKGKEYDRIDSQSFDQQLKLLMQNFHNF